MIKVVKKNFRKKFSGDSIAEESWKFNWMMMTNVNVTDIYFPIRCALCVTVVKAGDNNNAHFQFEWWIEYEAYFIYIIHRSSSSQMPIKTTTNPSANVPPLIMTTTMTGAALTNTGKCQSKKKFFVHCWKSGHSIDSAVLLGHISSELMTAQI